MADGGGVADFGMSVVPEDVRAVGRFASGVAEDVANALQAVAREIDELASGDWLGEAGVEFGAGWAQCRDSGVAVLNALTTMAEKLGANADSLHAVDAATTAALDKAGHFRLNIAPTTFPGTSA